MGTIWPSDKSSVMAGPSWMAAKYTPTGLIINNTANSCSPVEAHREGGQGANSQEPGDLNGARMGPQRKLSHSILFIIMNSLGMLGGGAGQRGLQKALRVL